MSFSCVGPLRAQTPLRLCDQQSDASFLPIEIVNCYGSDLTENALNHRFRRLKALNVIIREAREQKLDLVNLTCEENKLPNAQDKVDVKSTSFLLSFCLFLFAMPFLYQHR